MKIEHENNVIFCELALGDCFLLDGCLYIKVEGGCAADLGCGRLICVEPNQAIMSRKAKVTYEDS